MQMIQGKHLRVGDTIKVWWSSYAGQTPNQDTITSIEAYHGPLEHLWPHGARLVWFRFNAVVGMTIDNDDYYERLS